jgi:DnaJ-class molecular chaperone
VIVKTPKNLTKRQEEILREFEETGGRKEKKRAGGSYLGLKNKSLHNISYQTLLLGDF